MTKSSFSTSPAELQRFDRLAARLGCPRSHLLRVAMLRILDAPFDDVRREVETVARPAAGGR